MRTWVVLLTMLLVLPPVARGVEPKEIFAYTGDEIFALENLNEVVKANWSNMGSWLALYSASSPEGPIFVTMSFDERYEDMAQGGTREALANHFMALINGKAKKGIRLKRIANDGYVVTLDYADGHTIAWDYGDRESARTFKTGTPQPPHARRPRCPLFEARYRNTAR